ncbi:alfa-L-rhamnosidase [Paramyrothecium foliicola]|nr:alfa-L-rhamnosidase [Paramyrothecium foliicola]
MRPFLARVCGTPRINVKIRPERDFVFLSGHGDDARGDYLRGKITLFVAKGESVEGVQMKMVSRFIQEHSEDRAEWKFEESILHQWEPFMIGNGTGRSSWHGTTYEWPFEFLVPGNQKESFRGCRQCSFGYRLEGSAVGGSASGKILSFVPVRVTRGPESSSYELMDPTTSHGKWAGKTEYTASISHQAIALGGLIPVEAQIAKLDPDVTVTKARFYLRETHTARDGSATDATVDYLQRVVTEWPLEVGGKDSQIHCWQQCLELPKVVSQCSPDFSVYGCTSSHTLHFAATLVTGEVEMEYEASMPVTLFVSPELPITGWDYFEYGTEKITKEFHSGSSITSQREPQSFVVMSLPTLTKPTFEHHHNGLGVENSKPRISWRFQSTSATAPGWRQTAYEIEFTPGSESQEPKTVLVKSDQSVLVPWPAEPLSSREAATVRVRSYGASSEPSEWSPSATVEAALLSEGDFKANFITSAQHIGPHEPLQPIRLRKTFTLPDQLIGSSQLKARLYITALGVFNAWINGKPVTDECLAPGWTSYNHRLAYRVLDVTSLLQPGQTNVICAEVGEGWYAGRLGFGGGERFRYGKEVALSAQLEVSAASVDKAGPWTLVTDDSWDAAPSAIASSEIYDGEVFDFSKEVTAWNKPGSEWPSEATYGTKTLPRPSAKLVAPDAPPVRVTEKVRCQKVFKSKSGKTILDFGQNLVGYLSISRVEFSDNQTIVLRHAEVMEDGELGIRPLRRCKATDTITGAKGQVLENWNPQFTFHGFRYAQVDGWPAGEVGQDDIHALVIHTDMTRRGFFECSNEPVNQLHRNVVWSMRGNFVSVPTDCPQRDERLGWTGDLQAFCPTATFLYDTVGMLGNWLEDLSAEQLREGAKGIVPLVIPECMPSKWPHEADSQAVWGDVSIIAPNVLHQYSSDKALLERQFASMKAWLDEGINRAEDGLWNPNLFQLADWLDPNAPPEDPGKATTDSTLVANAYLTYVTFIFARLCAELGKKDLAAQYEEAAKKHKAQFQRRYITPDGNLMSNTQTGIALAIQFGLLPDEDAPREFVAASLEKLVRSARFHIATGFAGTPVIAHALTTIGRPQLAYRMLLETGCPSWLYPVVKQQATTIWERWDSMLPDGRINPGEMTSFNHYALGAVADWLHGSVGGIAPLEPGWRVVRVRPVPGGNLTSARVSFDGPYGLVACEWTLGGAASNEFHMTLTVPPNSSAVITLPAELRRDNKVGQETTRTVGSGTHEFKCVCDVDAWPPKPLIHPFMAPPEQSPIAAMATTTVTTETKGVDPSKMHGEEQHLEHGQHNLKEASAEAASKGQDVSGYETLSIWQTIKTFKVCTLVCFMVAFSGATDGYQIGINGNIVANPGFVRQFATVEDADGNPFLASPILAGWSSIMSVGQIVGMTTLPFISDRFGRKVAMFSYWFVLAMSVLAETLARSWPVWLVAKLLAGIGVGCLQSTIPTYISETAPARIRGGLLMSYNFWFGLGNFFAPVALQVLSQTQPDDWLTPIYTQWAQIGLMLAIYLCIPETPAWCASRGYEARAKKALRFLNWKVKDYNEDQQYRLLFLTIEHEMEVARASNNVHWWSIFKGIDGRRTLTALWTLMTQQFIGLTLFSTFASYFFQQAGVEDPFLATSITSAINIAAGLVFIVSADKVGRRLISCSGSTLSLVSCIAIGILGVAPQVNATSYLLIFFACLWNIGFTANGATGWGFIGEISSQRLRPYTAGFGAASTCVAGVVMNVLTPYMVNGNEWGWELKTGWFYAGIGLPFVVIMWFLIPETKGRTAAELDELFERKVKHWRFHKTQTATELLLQAN